MLKKSLTKFSVWTLVLMLAGAVIPISVNAQQLYRPVIRGTRGVVGAGTWLGTLAGIRMLEKGGNAIDAGVAAVLAGSVLETSHFGFGGEVPILIYSNKVGKVVAINGMGTAPKLVTIKKYNELGYTTDIPGSGIYSVTVPAVLDTCIVALDSFGTLSLADVMQPAIEYAEGFPMYELLSSYLANPLAGGDAAWRTSWGAEAAKIYRPGGRVLKPGEILVQKDLANTLKRIVAEEEKYRHLGRSRALQAARDLFYKGDIARAIGKYSEQIGSFLRYEDLAEYQAKVEEPVKTTYRGYEVYKCGFWTQGPVLIQNLNILEGFDLKAMGHNSPQYIHVVTEAMKLGYADRDDFYGDPEFARVPIKGLLSKEYAAERRALIDMNKASMERRPGNPWKYVGVPSPNLLAVKTGSSETPYLHDTTTVTAIDGAGNMFSATPSGAWWVPVIVPGTGISLSQRLQSSSLDPKSPNALEPGKKPRITLTPSMALKEGKPFMVFSTPGGDAQDQTLLQVFLNVAEFGMNPQAAIEAPRFDTLHLIGSFEGHPFFPGELRLEDRIPKYTEVVKELEAKGHKVKSRGAWGNPTAPTAIVYDSATGVITGGADIRRDRYCIGY